MGKPQSGTWLLTIQTTNKRFRQKRLTNVCQRARGRHTLSLVRSSPVNNIYLIDVAIHCIISHISRGEYIYLNVFSVLTEVAALCQPACC